MSNEKDRALQWTVITVSVVAIAVCTIILVIVFVAVPVVLQVTSDHMRDPAEFATWEAEARELAAAEQELLRETNVYRVHFTTKAVKDRDFDTYDEARRFVLDTFAEDIAADPDKWAWEGECVVEGGVAMFGNVAARPIKPSATITHLRVMKSTEPPGPAEPSPVSEGLLKDQLDWIDSL